MHPKSIVDLEGAKMRGINFAIAMGMALLIPMLITYGVNLLHPPPDHEDYQSVGLPGPGPVSEEEAARREELSKKDRDNFNAARMEYEQLFFYVALPVGLALVVGGVFVGVSSISNGMVFGGVFTLIMGYYSNWNQLSDGIKFVSLLIALALFVFAAYRTYSRSQTGGG